MYFGRAREAANFFGTMGFLCPESFSPADFFLDVVSMDYRSSELEQTSRQRIRLIAGTGRLLLLQGVSQQSSCDMFNGFCVSHAGVQAL